MIVVFIYNILLYIAAIILLPFTVIMLLFNKKWRAGAGERLGKISKDDLEKLCNKKILWFHAASVGEVQAVVPVIKEMKAVNPDYVIVATTTSTDGKNKIKAELGEILAFAALLPLDINFIMKNFIKNINPFGIVLVETEIWPNFIYYAADHGIPAMMVNGRISNKSFKFYHMFGIFFRFILERMVFFIMQSEKMKIRLKMLGIKDEKINILSNTKYSTGIAGHSGGKINFDKKGKKFITAGSTRKGEEKLVIDAFKPLKGQSNVLIIAPRKMARVKPIVKMLEKEGIKYVLWSDVKDYTTMPDYEAIVINTIGDLPYLYEVSDVAIIGGGFKKFGGHNPIEAAILGLPIIIGRYMYNFEDTAERLLRDGGTLQAESSAEDINSKLVSILGCDSLRSVMGEKNRAVVEGFKGSALKTAKIIDRIISTYRIIKENKKNFKSENVRLVYDEKDKQND